MLHAPKTTLGMGFLQPILNSLEETRAYWNEVDNIVSPIAATSHVQLKYFFLRNLWPHATCTINETRYRVLANKLWWVPMKKQEQIEIKLTAYLLYSYGYISYTIEKYAHYPRSTQNSEVANAPGATSISIFVK